MGGEVECLDLGITVMGDFGGISFVLSFIYSSRSSRTLGGYYVDGVLACMNDVVLMMLERGNK